MFLLWILISQWKSFFIELITSLPFKIDLFNCFGCAGPLVLQMGFLYLQPAGAALCCGTRAPHCTGFSCCGAQALGHAGFSSCSGFSGCDSQAQEHRLSSMEHGLRCSMAGGIFLHQGSISVPCITWQIFNHETTREDLITLL